MPRLKRGDSSLTRLSPSLSAACWATAAVAPFALVALVPTVRYFEMYLFAPLILGPIELSGIAHVVEFGPILIPNSLGWALMFAIPWLIVFLVSWVALMWWLQRRLTDMKCFRCGRQAFAHGFFFMRHGKCQSCGVAYEST